MTSTTKQREARGSAGHPRRRSSVERFAARRRQRRRTALLWGIAVATVLLIGGAIVLVVGGGSDAPPAAAPGVEVAGPAREAPLEPGTPFPSFAAPALEGGRASWSAGDAGPTVIAVWAPWCPHCRHELPILDAVGREFPAVELVTVMTAVDVQPGPDPTTYLRDEGLTFPVAVDDEEGTMARALGIRSFPTTYFVNEEGRVVHTMIGAGTEEEVRAAFALVAG
jgi:thiol-disulfide isomerase/thioredoxin